ncbi:MAG: hypothetical protein ACE5EM_12435 [Sphingomonadales bacterium]
MTGDWPKPETRAALVLNIIRQAVEKGEAITRLDIAASAGLCPDAVSVTMTHLRKRGVAAVERVDKRVRFVLLDTGESTPLARIKRGGNSARGLLILKRNYAPRTGCGGMRSCVTCGVAFKSEGSHNRMCIVCRRKEPCWSDGWL